VDAALPNKRLLVDAASESESLKTDISSEPLATAQDAPEPYVRPEPTPLEAAVKEVKAAYITAKKAYRISEQRRARVQEVLNSYLGTQNFHNYTIQKRFSDPSAKRVIRSFNVGKDPIIINDTEWLSLKVHGQSFMMHQIRKMVAMAVCFPTVVSTTRYPSVPFTVLTDFRHWL
jgi:tRNA pseudouridine38-40 synthase